MIRIKNLQPAAGGTGWTCDATVDGQAVNGIRVNTDRLRDNIILPASAGHIDWGDATIADVEDAVKREIKAIIGWVN